MKIIESPREAFQAFPRNLSADDKVRYINHLVRAGFYAVEVGSLASPARIPQLADSLEVLERLDLSGTKPNLMFLALNENGAAILAQNERITSISYPFSFSSAFSRHNLNTTVEASFETARSIIERCAAAGKEAVIYISMAFGNPYGDPWSIELLCGWIEKLQDAGARTIVLSNVSVPVEPETIAGIYLQLIHAFPTLELGFHLHTHSAAWHAQVTAAYLSGCRRFDGVLRGMGGCPMTGGALLGNLATENLIAYATENGILLSVDQQEITESINLATEIFSPFRYLPAGR